MEKMKKIINVIERTNNIVGEVVKYLLLYMAITLTVDVIARYVFNSPTVWIFELCKHSMLYLGALGGGFTLLNSGHVKVDVFYSLLSIRGKAIADIATSFLFFIFITVMIWKCTGLALASYHHMEHATTAFGAPIFQLKIAVVIGAVLMFLQGVSKLLKDILTLLTGEKQEYKTLAG